MIKTNITLKPIPIALSSELVIPKVGHNAKKETNVGFSSINDSNDELIRKLKNNII